MPGHPHWQFRCRPKEIRQSYGSPDPPVPGRPVGGADLHPVRPDGRHRSHADVYHYTQEGYNLTGTEAGQNAASYAITGRNPCCGTTKVEKSTPPPHQIRLNNRRFWCIVDKEYTGPQEGILSEKVIIVGAGPAGLTAAYELLKKSETRWTSPYWRRARTWVASPRLSAIKANRMDNGRPPFLLQSAGGQQSGGHRCCLSRSNRPGTTFI